MLNYFYKNLLLESVKGSEEYELLVDLLVVYDEVNNIIEDRTELTENQQKVREIVHKVSGTEEILSKESYRRKLLLEGNVNFTIVKNKPPKKEDGVAFLFNDMILLAKKQRGSTLPIAVKPPATYSYHSHVLFSEAAIEIYRKLPLQL